MWKVPWQPSARDIIVMSMSSMLAQAKGIVAKFRTFNGEHLSHGWPVFLIVRMSLKWAGIMAAIRDGGVYTAPRHV